MKYDAEVKAAIAQVNPAIDPALVHAIIQKESSHGAVLSTAESGGRYSYGPMMVLDSTAAGFGVSDPTALERDPAVGIFYGVLYLNDRINLYGPDWSEVISAYNAGSPLSDGSGGYRNQDYVNKVTALWQQYRALAPAGGSALILAALAGLWVYLRRRRR